MANSGLKAENADNPKTRGRQRSFSDNDVGSRILSALAGKPRKWLAGKAGISESSISDYIANGIAKADAAVAIADALGVSVDWLLIGAKGSTRSQLLVSADQADWVEVPEYSLLEIDELGKLEPVAATMMRKDWLYTTLGDTSGIWIARLFARYDPLDIDYGAALFCKDCKPGDRLGDGLYYLFRTNGAIIMAPFTSRDSGAADDAVHRRDIGAEEDQYQPVARVIGQFARPV